MLNWTHFSDAKSRSFRNRVLRLSGTIDMVLRTSHFREICSFKAILVTSVTRAMQRLPIKATNLSVSAISLRVTNRKKMRLANERARILNRVIATSDSLFLKDRQSTRFGTRIPTLMVFKSLKPCRSELSTCYMTVSYALLCTCMT